MVSQPGYDVVFWAQGFGARGKFESDGNATNVRRDLAGFFSGVDTRVGTNGRARHRGGLHRLEVCARRARNIERRDRPSHGLRRLELRRAQSARRRRPCVAFDRYQPHRRVPGLLRQPDREIQRQHRPDLRRGRLWLCVRQRRGRAVRRCGLVTCRPMRRHERGGAAALAVAANSFSVGYSTLGIRAASMIPVGHDMVLVPRASLAWQHAFNDVTPEARLAFIAAPVPFVIAGAPIARDSFWAKRASISPSAATRPSACPTSGNLPATSRTTPPRASSPGSSSRADPRQAIPQTRHMQ